MADRTITLDDLVSDIEDHLHETDTDYVAGIAGKVLTGTFSAMSDGDNIRHSGVKWSMASVITDIVGAVGEMEPADAARFATSLLSHTYEADTEGNILVTFVGDSTPSPR